MNLRQRILNRQQQRNQALEQRKNQLLVVSPQEQELPPVVPPEPVVEPVKIKVKPFRISNTKSRKNE